MGFFDTFRRKKDDLGLPPVSGKSNAGLGEPPIDSHSSLNSPNKQPDNVFTSPGSQPNLSSPNMGQPQQSRTPDPRMSMPLGQSLKKSPSNPHASFPNQKQNPLKHDFELLSSKLDYLKASIEAVNQRLANLEHLVKQEQEKRKW